MKSGQKSLAEGILKLVAQEKLNSAGAKQAHFRIVVGNGNRGDIVKTGSQLIEDQEADEFTYQQVIEALLLDGSERLAQKFANMGLAEFPSLSKYL